MSLLDPEPLFTGAYVEHKHASFHLAVVLSGSWKCRPWTGWITHTQHHGKQEESAAASGNLNSSQASAAQKFHLKSEKKTNLLDPFTETPPPPPQSFSFSLSRNLEPDGILQFRLTNTRRRCFLNQLELLPCCCVEAVRSLKRLLASALSSESKYQTVMAYLVA